MPFASMQATCFLRWFCWHVNRLGRRQCSRRRQGDGRICHVFAYPSLAYWPPESIPSPGNARIDLLSPSRRFPHLLVTCPFEPQTPRTMHLTFHFIQPKTKNFPCCWDAISGPDLLLIVTQCLTGIDARHTMLASKYSQATLNALEPWPQKCGSNRSCNPTSIYRL